MAGVDDDGGVVKISGVAYCRERRDPRRGFLLQSHKRCGQFGDVIKCQQGIRH
jgi:hypothetical protein